MQKAINIENTGKNIERILSITEPEIVENDSKYIIVDNFPESLELKTSMSVNYAFYDTGKMRLPGNKLNICIPTE